MPCARLTPSELESVDAEDSVSAGVRFLFAFFGDECNEDIPTGLRMEGDSACNLMVTRVMSKELATHYSIRDSLGAIRASKSLKMGNPSLWLGISASSRFAVRSA